VHFAASPSDNAPREKRSLSRDATNRTRMIIRDSNWSSQSVKLLLAPRKRADIGPSFSFRRVKTICYRTSLSRGVVIGNVSLLAS